MDPNQLGIWLTFAVIVVALVMYTLERLTFELTSLGVICVLLVFFHFVPVVDADGNNILDPTQLLAGFANPALLTVIALLVMGDGLGRTGVLEAGAQMFFRYGRGHAALASGLANGLGLPVEPFAVAVVFAANCSFASPVGYQTNLLVMAPGNYRFVDFVCVGTPLLVNVWLVFSLVAPWYYGLV